MSRHVYFVPHLLKITFTSPPVYFASIVLCIPFKVTFTSDHVYFASRLPRPRLRCVTSTLRHVYFASFYLATRLFSITFTFLPVCLASRFFFLPFALRHVHFAPRLLAFTFTFCPVYFPSRSFRFSWARLTFSFSPVYLCYVHLTCRFLSFTFTVSLVFFLLRSLRFSFLPSCSLFSPFTLRLVRFAPLNVRPVHFAPHLQTQWLKEATSLHTRTVSGKRVISINAFFWDFAKQRFQRSTFKDAANYFLPSCYRLRILQFNIAQIHLLKHNWWNKKCKAKFYWFIIERYS